MSQPPFNTLNLGNINKDRLEDVLANRQIVKEILGCERLFVGEQKHTNTVAIVKEEHLPSLIEEENPFPETDGIITNVKNIGLLTLAADCTPIILFDPQKQVIGVVHSGWKGTELKILSVALQKMMDEFESEAKDILICFGPFIKKESYEIGEDVIELFKNAYPEIIDEVILPHPIEGKAFLNIEAAQLAQCNAFNIPSENIQFLPFDTYTDHRFYSARKAAPMETGRFGGVIVLR
ncbi:peptidoglycan editing factor PgeF [Flammeovirga agarivorans]|uniref:Purine nucleoside phosphorylase n=1 Tax=Flammeovirga agarivorans TaxID=2726742 RepID=A0A7X8SHP9_9BACT|nr:peptidoglycan editing factor PgeF [Flammeovirga agarivorans]NLR90404.1 peptidoglycan editing factor PgeF [Flammeovirga agarivorans]